MPTGYVGEFGAGVHSLITTLYYASGMTKPKIKAFRGYPDWHTDFYDFDIAQAAASKQRLFNRAASEEALILAFHFHPFPSLGHVISEGEGWHWQPLA